MDILIGLVIAMFIITAAYIGYNASQEPIKAEVHDIPIKSEIITIHANKDTLSNLQMHIT